MKKYQIALICSLFLAFPLWANDDEVTKMENQFKKEFKSELSKLNSFFQLKSTPIDFMNGTNENEENTLDLSRVNLLVGAFTELDLKILDITIQPYVEFRFDKKNP